MLRAFRPLLDAVLPGQFEPAREQLYLATVLALHEAFYQVREAEAQALFRSLSRRNRRPRTSTTCCGGSFASSPIRFMPAPAGCCCWMPLRRGKVARPLYIERGEADEKLIADPKMRGQYASYWSFPIRPAALLQFGFAERYPWLPRELTLLHAVAERCQEAIEKARLQDEIRRLEAGGATGRGGRAPPHRPRIAR